MRKKEMQKVLGVLANLEKGDEFTWEVKKKEPPRGSWPTVEVFGGRMYGQYCRTRSLIHQADAVIGLPRHKDSRGTIVKLDDVQMGGDFRNPDLGGGYIGSYIAENGDQYAFPGDPEGGRCFLRLKKGETKFEKLIELSYSQQIRSGAILNGWMICPRFDRGRSVWGFHVEAPRRHEIFPFDYSIKASGQAYWACVSGGGKMYFLPWNESRVGKLDWEKGTVTAIGPELFPPRSGGGRYRYAAYCPKRNKSYAFAAYGSGMLIIDHETDEVREVPMFEELRDLFKGSVSFSTIQGPDGNFYSSPTQEPWLVRFNPDTEELGFKNLRIDFEKANLVLEEPGYGYSTDSKLIGESIYYGAGGTTRMFRLKFNDKVKS